MNALDQLIVELLHMFTVHHLNMFLEKGARPILKMIALRLPLHTAKDEALPKVVDQSHSDNITVHQSPRKVQGHRFGKCRWPP